MSATPIAAPPKRRWYQYSLRTLLIVVTLLAIPSGYVGWQANIVRERQAMLAWIKKAGGADFPYVPWAQLKKYPPPPLPWIREQFGDEWVVWIYYPKSFQPRDLERIRKEFPEAELSESPSDRIIK